MMIPNALLALIILWMSPVQSGDLPRLNLAVAPLTTKVPTTWYQGDQRIDSHWWMPIPSRGVGINESMWLEMRIECYTNASVWETYGVESELDAELSRLRKLRSLWYSLRNACDISNAESQRESNLEEAKRIMGPLNWYLGTIPRADE